jgi:hypothetical protein
MLVYNSPGLGPRLARKQRLTVEEARKLVDIQKIRLQNVEGKVLGAHLAGTTMPGFDTGPVGQS